VKKRSVSRPYFTLVASLPALPHFTQAERLPINRERLQERFAMLDPQDAELMERAADFLAFQRHPAARSEAEMELYYRKLCEVVKHPTLLALLQFPVNVRTIVAALRRRQAGEPPPKPGEPWGFGPWVRHIEQHWEHPDFKLAPVFPWITQVRLHLENQEALALERLLMNLIWQHVERVVPGGDFTLETLLAYLFKWDMVLHWLSYDAEAGRQRFEELATGVLDDYGPIFQ